MAAQLSNEARLEAHPISPVSTTTTAFVGRALQGPIDTPVRVTSLAEFESIFGPATQPSALGYLVRDFFTNGGSDAVVVRLFAPGDLGDATGAPLVAADIVGPGLRASGAGLYALDRAEQFNLLVIAPHTPDGCVDPAVVRDADEYCRDRRAVLLLEAPAGWVSAEVALDAGGSGLDAVIGTSSADAALFYPRLRRPSLTRGGTLEDFSPLGAVAGVIARTEGRSGVWVSPAGQQALLNRVPALAVELTTRQVSALTAAGVNCLRSIPGGGRVVWGARTMQGSDRAGSEWKYLSVRRTALMIEESLERGTRWVAFEPNTEPTWAQVRKLVDDFMHGLFRAGAFPSSTTPSEGYFVKCGHDTMTEDDIKRGVLTVLVGFAPIRAGEFVTVRVSQDTAGAA